MFVTVQNICIRICPVDISFELNNLRDTAYSLEGKEGFTLLIYKLLALTETSYILVTNFIKLKQTQLTKKSDMQQ